MTEETTEVPAFIMAFSYTLNQGANIYILCEMDFWKVLLFFDVTNFHFSSDAIKYSFIRSPVELGVAHMPNLFFVVKSRCASKRHDKGSEIRCISLKSIYFL